MKKAVILFIFALGVFSSNCQDLNILLKLNKISLSLGIPNSLSIDTALLKTNGYKINPTLTEQHLYLLRAAESFVEGKFENSNYYISKVNTRFKTPDHNTLKYFLTLAGYVHSNNLEKTADYYYLVFSRQLLPPDCMQKINSLIAGSFSRSAFDEALMPYFYFHQRMKILDDIKLK